MNFRACCVKSKDAEEMWRRIMASHPPSAPISGQLQQEVWSLMCSHLPNILSRWAPVVERLRMEESDLVRPDPSYGGNRFLDIVMSYAGPGQRRGKLNRTVLVDKGPLARAEKVKMLNHFIFVAEDGTDCWVLYLDPVSQVKKNLFCGESTGGSSKMSFLILILCWMFGDVVITNIMFTVLICLIIFIITVLRFMITLEREMSDGVIPCRPAEPPPNEKVGWPRHICFLFG